MFLIILSSFFQHRMSMVSLIFVVALVFNLVLGLARDVNVLIVGVEGSGKASLIENLGQVDGLTSIRALPVPQADAEYKTMWAMDGEDINISFFVSRIDVKSIKRFIANHRTAIHRVVVLVKADKNLTSLNELNNALAMLTEVGLTQKNALTYITHMDIYDKKTKDLNKGIIIDYFQKVLPVDPQVKCFAFPPHMDEELMPFYEKWAKADTKEFKRTVSEHIEPFYPHEHVSCNAKMVWYDIMKKQSFKKCLEEQEELRQKSSSHSRHMNTASQQQQHLDKRKHTTGAVIKSITEATTAMVIKRSVLVISVLSVSMLLWSALNDFIFFILENKLLEIMIES